MQKIVSRLHHFFIPSEKNNFRARLLHLDVLTGIIALFAIFNLSTTAIGTVLGLATDITVTRLYEMTNRKRVEQGLQALSYNGKLAEAAQKKAEDMIAKNYWAHYPPGGGTPWDFVVGAGYKYEFAGENLAHGFMFSDQVVEAWMNSDSHRSNLLKSEYDEVGFAVLNGTLQGEPTTLVVQMFGAPASGVVASNIAVEAKEPVGKTVEEPTGVPTEAPKINEKKEISSGAVTGNSLSFDRITFSSSLIVISLLILTLMIDLGYAYRHRLLRLTGKNIAHLMFLTVVLLAVFMLTKGIIL